MYTIAKGMQQIGPYVNFHHLSRISLTLTFILSDNMYLILHTNCHSEFMISLFVDFYFYSVQFYVLIDEF